MPHTHKDPHHDAYGRRAYVTPMLWIVALVGCYWLLADWQAVPALISATVAAIH